MKIVVLGDSFTFGQGCSDTPMGYIAKPSEYAWPSLIQKEFAVTVDNRSRPGYSNASIVERLHQELTDDIKLVICCVSFAARIQIRRTENAAESIGPNWQSDRTFPQLETAVEHYYKYLYSDRIGHASSITTLLAAYASAQLVGADFLWCMPDPVHIPSLNNHVLDRLRDSQFLSFADFKWTKAESSVCDHPNNDGHQRYYNQVIVPVLKNKLTGIQ